MLSQQVPSTKGCKRGTLADEETLVDTLDAWAFSTEGT